MSTSNSPALACPFLELPTEIRVLIYEYLVVAPKAELSVISIRQPRPAEADVHTSILLVNHLVYGEASTVLYAKNNVELYIYGFCDRNICDSIFRVDTRFGKIMSLRDGRSINTRTHSGMIYPHILQRFARLTLIVTHYSYPPWRPSNQRLLKSKEVMRLFGAPDDGIQSRASKFFSLEIRILNFDRRREVREKDFLLDLCKKDGIISLLKDMRKRRTVEIRQGNLAGAAVKALRLAIKEDEE